jgi:hypothetical protein
MPIHNFIDPAHRVVITICSGRLTREQLVSAFEELMRHPDFDPDYRQLIDLSPATPIELSYKDLSDINNSGDSFSNREKRALVALRGSAWYGVARMSQGIANSPRMEVFDSLINALAWLQLEATILGATVNTVSTTRAGTESEILNVPDDASATFQPTKKPLCKR